MQTASPDQDSDRHFISSLQYADDAALTSHTADGLQRVLDAEDDTFTRCGLVINAAKTEIGLLCQPSLHNRAGRPPQFHAGSSRLACVDHFTYLGSVLSSTCLLDAEIEARVRQASTAFGRLRKRVFTNKDLTTATDAMLGCYRGIRCRRVSLCLAVTLRNISGPLAGCSVPIYTY